MKIFIDWRTIDSYEQFFDIFLPQVKAPVWHGKNLDAFSDSIITGGVKQIILGRKYEYSKNSEHNKGRWR